MANEFIELNVIPNGEKPVFHAAQYDVCRPIIIKLKKGEDDFTPTGLTLELQVRKVDNNIVTAAASSVDGNIVTFLTTAQMTACSGTNLCEVQLSDASTTIATLHFFLVVQRDVLNGGLSSASEIHDLEEQIAEIVPEVIGDDYYDKTEVDALIAEHTFDPTNYYDKATTNALLADKADTADLATVATSGDYDDLLNKPTLPDMSNYYTKSETYNKTEVDNALATKQDKIETKTASGDLITITDGGDNIPLKSCVATINTNTPISKLKLYHEYEINSWADISKLVKSGDAPDLLPVGSIITDKWQNGSGGTIYDYPWIVSNYGNYEKADGTTMFGMVLQAQYCDPIGMPFSGYSALLACPNGLSSGTYHFKCSANWGNISGNTDYQFTLTQDVPNNGLVCAPNNWPDVALANWKITTYASNTSATAIEQVALTAGNGGTDLGTFTPGYQSATMNGYQTAAYGYNRWSKSAIRQWLNSDAAAGAWWHPQTVWDMAPSKAATERGFLAGFSDDFKHILHETKIKTALNTSDKTKEGVGFEYTYDKLFLPALEQMYINPQATGDDAEGAFWEYYKELNGTDTKFAQGGTYPELIKYDLTNHSTARYQRLRSAARGGSYLTWSVNDSGTVYYHGYAAIAAFQCAPACIII